jgi:hypothetical protein
MERVNLISRLRLFVSLFAFVALVAAASDALAKPRVGVLVFQGPGETAFRAKVVKALKTNGYQIVGGKQLAATASSAGVSLDGDSGFATVAKELAISAFVAGDIGKKKATFTVRNGADGSVISEASFAGPNPAKIKAAVAAGFWKKLGGAVAKGTPPSGAKTKSAVAEEAEPADNEEDKSSGSSDSSSDSSSSSSSSEEKTEEKSSEGEEEKPAPKPRKKKAAAEAEAASGQPGALKALSVGLGAKAFWRKFEPHQDRDTSLSSYSISPGAAGVLWLDVFPAAFAMDGFAANVGLTGGFEKGLAITSKSKDGLTKFTTDYSAFDVGVKVRFPLDGIIPFVAGTYGKQTYKLTPQGGANRPDGVLDVDYSYVQGTVGASFALAPEFSLDAQVAYIQVLNPGAMIRSSDYFPRSKAYGADLGLSAIYYATPLIGVRAGFDFRQYGHSFNVKDGDAHIVGGAIDRYVSLFAGVEIALDASPAAP